MDLTVTVTAATHPGQKRENNEDNHAIWIAPDPDERARRGVLFVVSDGMGGSQAGEVASRLTVDTVLRIWSERGGEQPRDDLRAAVEAANRAVHEQAQSSPRMAGMGATCTVVVVRQRDAWLAHVGDSRAYLIRRGHIRQLTQDHSLVAQLIQRHELTAEEARVDPRRNVVTRSVGIAEEVEIDAEQLDFGLEPGDTLLVCSDGLHGLVSDEELARLAGGEDPRRAVKALIDLANERGGPDNITAVLARIEGEGGGAGDRPRGAAAPAHAAAPARERATRSTLLLIVALLALVIALLIGYWALTRFRAEASRLESVDDRDASTSDTTLRFAPDDGRVV